MNIRAITVERGIATLVHQSQLPTLLSLHSRGRRHHENAETGTDPVDTISSPTDNPERQEEEELQGGFYDHENGDIWSEDDEASEGELQQEDRSAILTRSVPNDIERCIPLST